MPAVRLDKFDPTAYAAPIWRERIVSESLLPERYANNSAESLFLFLTECCYTYNEANARTELIPPWPYVRWIAERWSECKRTGRPLIMEKSRRMGVSWIFRGCELHSACNSQQKAIICGLNYRKAADHVWRIWWLYEQMRKRCFELPLQSCRGGDPGLRELDRVLLPNGSTVESLNQEGQAFQGSGYGYVAMEEFSQYKYPNYMWAQAKIVTEGVPGRPGGFVMAVSNACASPEWKELKK